MKRCSVAPSLCIALLALARPVSAAERKRELPDYSNRSKDPLTLGDVAIWVPGILLSPAYLVTEYRIRWPLGHAIAAAERAKVWAGAIIGFAVGYGMPTIFPYGKAGKGSEASLTVQPVGSGFPGPTISGTF